MAKETVSFRIDSDKRKALGRVAKLLDRDRSYIICQAISDFIEIQESQIACIGDRIKQAAEERRIAPGEIGFVRHVFV